MYVGGLRGMLLFKRGNHGAEKLPKLARSCTTDLEATLTAWKPKRNPPEPSRGFVMSPVQSKEGGGEKVPRYIPLRR